MDLPQMLRNLFLTRPPSNKVPSPRNPPQVSLDSCLGSVFLDLPTEIIFMIMKELKLSEILKFSLSSRLCYTHAVPILKHSIVITQHSEPTFRESALACNHDSGHVRSVQLGRMDRPGAAERWNISQILRPILVSFQNLDTLIMVGGSFVKGWEGLDEVGRELGDTLKHFRIRLEPPFSRDETMVPSFFANLESFSLSISGMDARSQHFQDILREVSVRFPVLRQLKIGFHIGAFETSGFVVPAQYPCTFFSDPLAHFPLLRSFDLALPLCVSLRLSHSDSQSLLQFLDYHKGTLRELALPSFMLPVLSNGDAFSIFTFPPMRLSRLQSGIDIIDAISRLNHDPDNPIQHLTLDMRSSARPFLTVGEEVRSIATQWPHQTVRRLTIFAPGIGVDYTGIPLFFPLLEDLRIQFVSLAKYESPVARNFARWETQREQFLSLAHTLRKLTVQLIHKIEIYRVERVGSQVNIILEDHEQEACSYWTS